MIQYLQTFVAVARLGSFSAAGDRLGLSQSAVSTQMRKLEESIGNELFDRQRRGTVLTHAGRRALTVAERIVGLYDDMRNGLEDELLSGTLRAGSIMTGLLGEVIDAVVDFRKRYPNTDVHLTPGSSAELLAMVEKHILDCALIVKPPFPVHGLLSWRPVRNEPYVLWVPQWRKDSDVGELLATQPFIRYDRRSHGGASIDHFLKQRKHSVKEFMEVDSVETIAMLVARGLGVAILPSTPSLKKLGLEIREISLGEHTFFRQIGLIERLDNPRAHLNNEFFDSLLATSPE
jgi:DNA-binding transcriptional LysR family regulator